MGIGEMGQYVSIDFICQMGHAVFVSHVDADYVLHVLTGDQTLRTFIIKQINEFSYDELEFHLADSMTYRWFCGYGAFDKSPKKS
jgi:hypothetical protein